MKPVPSGQLGRVLGDPEIVSTEHAREAPARIENNEQFDIIFCDLMIPNVTGMDFYEALPAQHPETAAKVVFLTGAVMASKAASFLDTVPNRRIQKPFDVDSLCALVQERLAELEKARSLLRHEA